MTHSSSRSSPRVTGPKVRRGVTRCTTAAVIMNWARVSQRKSARLHGEFSRTSCRVRAQPPPSSKRPATARENDHALPAWLRINVELSLMRFFPGTPRQRPLVKAIPETLAPGRQESPRFAAEVPLVVLPSAHGAVADRLEDLSVARCADESPGACVLSRRKHRLVHGQLQKCAQPADLGRKVRRELLVFQLMGSGSQQGALRVPEAKGARIRPRERRQITPQQCQMRGEILQETA